MRDNPLMTMTGLPPFSQIKPEHAVPALTQILSENRAQIKALLDNDEAPSWDNLVAPLELLDDRLNRLWSPVRHMNSVLNSDELRDAYNECVPLLTEYSTELGQNLTLYKAFDAIKQSDAFSSMTPTRQKVIENSLRSFRLSGVALDDADKNRYKEISLKLSELTNKFSQNVLDATNVWEKRVKSASALKGLPSSALDMAKQAAKERGLKSGYVLTLQFPSFNAVMTYAEDRALREEVYRAFTTRASELGDDAEYDNSANMLEILSLRQESAVLLGYANFAERSLATKMAESEDKVFEFLFDLSDKSKPHAEKDFETLKSFAAEHLSLDDVKAWDVGFISEKMRNALYDFSQEALKPYFAVESVLAGMFELTEKLFNVTIKAELEFDTWHPDVRFYSIFDSEGQLKAQFYFDLFTRQDKRGGAWMDVCLSRHQSENGLQLPVAYLTCNSAPPAGGKPAMFTHQEVTTLFHEFGHGLHHMLTRVDELDVSGISGVEWDAVELPSQFMENFCWEREVLDMFARHYETDEKLPEDLFDKLTRSKNFQAAMMMMRQLEFAVFDLKIHSLKAEGDDFVQTTLNEVREKIAVVQPPESNRFQHSFTHIFAGGYSAGYFSYKWAEVLSADAYARFEEDGLFNEETANAFQNEILAVGGSRDAMKSFVAFRGREPSVDALLRHNGLV